MTRDFIISHRGKKGGVSGEGAMTPCGIMRQ